MGKLETSILLMLGVTLSLGLWFGASSASASTLNKSSVDESSLVSIAAYINSEILASNWSKETSFCNWSGIVCGKKHPERVIALNLSNMGLHGSIAKEIGNLSFLRFVDMSNNSINGLIPDEIGRLRRLRVLNMALNQLRDGIPQSIGLLGKLHELNLSNNYLSGDIPSTLSGCTDLRMFDLSHNYLTGNVPPGFGNWSKLQKLSLKSNYLTGRIPVSIGNLSNLGILDVSLNSIYGRVVSEIGQLSSLRILNLGANNLSGEVPEAIFNLSKLEFLSLRENNLSGSLPFSIDKGLPNIQQIFLGNIQRRFDLQANQFHGKIPNSISNLSKLITLDLSDNSFTYVPMNLGNLHQLQVLNLEANLLTNHLSNPQQDFLSSLAACKNLKFIGISFNPITGVLPKSLGSNNLSISLETLKAFSCRILDPIPDEIRNLSNLLSLNLGYNHFTGAIPSALGRLRSLRNLEIHGNRFHGFISPVLCNLNHLYLLNLAMNNLSGQLPSCLGNLSLLREIYMSDNEFDSNLASVLWFRKGVSNVKSLVALDLSRNQFSGEIPSTISQLGNLVRLSLSRNKLEGSIVESFTDLKDLQHLDLSHNHLSGPIPKSLEALPHLNHFDVSFNELRGEIPDRGCFINFTAKFFIGNKGLCGAPRFKVKKCKSLSMISYISVLIVVIIGLVLVLLWKTSARKPDSSSTEFPPYEIFWKVSYEKILHATGNLDENNLIGTGSVGSVYKGKFNGENVYAVKVFDLDVQDALKSFDTECRILSSVRHRNIVSAVTCCSQMDFKALVTIYMPNGDLDKMLYSTNCSLNIFQRLGILKDVACAIEHLHEYHIHPIVHCDINPKNIFLDEYMGAHVGDFGIAKVLSQEERMLHSTTLGTVGYIAPEYGSQGLISTMVDVYSYGILMMEMLTRRKPTDEMFSGELTLRRWVMGSFTDSVNQIVESEVLNMDHEAARVRVVRWLTQVVEIALECSADLPEERPNMNYVAARITRINSDSFRDRICYRLLTNAVNLNMNNGNADAELHSHIPPGDISVFTTGVLSSPS